MSSMCAGLYSCCTLFTGSYGHRGAQEHPRDRVCCCVSSVRVCQGLVCPVPGSLTRTALYCGVCVLPRVLGLGDLGDAAAGCHSSAGRQLLRQPTLGTANCCGAAGWVSWSVGALVCGSGGLGAGLCWKQGRHGRVPLLHAQNVCLCGLLAQHDPGHCQPGAHGWAGQLLGLWEQDSVLAKQAGLVA